MLSKEQLRIKFFKHRKKEYYEVNYNFFKPIFKLLKSLFKEKKIFLSCYYPSSYEVNTLKLFKLISEKKNIQILLPKINSSGGMKFVKWKILNLLTVNKYGFLEPSINNKFFVPHVMIIPLLAFDIRNNRLGYGKGYYDKYLSKFLVKNKKKILTIGVAFSFQKYNKLPTSKFDVKLDYILTERGLKKTQ